MTDAAAQGIARYDAAYFDRWYRDPARRVSTRAAAERKARLVLSVAEYYLQRPVRSVLDVGCGEGQWQPILTAMRPKLRYEGVDASAYAVAKYGRRRSIRLGTFGDLHTLPLADAYDLIVCSDMLYYVDTPALRRGLRTLVPRMAGIAFLEAYTSDDPVEGDTRTWEPRTATFWRRLFRDAGLVSCGSHCFAGAALAPMVTSLEHGFP